MEFPQKSFSSSAVPFHHRASWRSRRHSSYYLSGGTLRKTTNCPQSPRAFCAAFRNITMKSTLEPQHGLWPKRHTPEDLAELLSRNSKNYGKTLSQSQVGAMKQYERLICSKDFTDTTLLVEAFSIFDNLFFFGSLRSRCVFQLFGYNRGLLESSSACHRYTCIRIYARADGFKSWIERAVGICSILLHEMCHAFLSIFTLTWMRKGNLSQEGRTGHGFVWYVLLIRSIYNQQSRKFPSTTQLLGLLSLRNLGKILHSR